MLLFIIIRFENYLKVYLNNYFILKINSQYLHKIYILFIFVQVILIMNF